MDTFLQVGDQFTSSKLNSMLYGDIARSSDGRILFDKSTGEPYVDFNNLHTEDYETTTIITCKETRDSGWSRDRQFKLSTKVQGQDFLFAIWLVIKTDFSGGGTGHGPHDVYPNGHFVLAQRIEGHETVSFYQSGCFIGMVEPKDIIKV